MEDNYYHNLLKRYYFYCIENCDIYNRQKEGFDKWFNDMKDMSEKYLKDVFDRYLNTSVLFHSKTIEEFDLNLSLRGYS